MSKPMRPLRLLVVFAVVSSVSSCSSPFTSTLQQASNDQLAGVVQLIGRSNGSAIGVSSPISFRFTRGLDEDSIELSGDLAEHGQLLVTETDIEGVRAAEFGPPTSGWPVGEGLSLRIDGSAAGADIVPAILAFTVVGDTIHVSSRKGRYTGTGTPAAPFNTVQRAVDFIQNEYEPGSVVEVRVSEGGYDLATPGLADEAGLRVPDGLTIRGGYSEDFGAWDPSAYPTAIVSRMGEAAPTLTLGNVTLDSLRIRDEGFVDQPLIEVEGEARLIGVTMTSRYGRALSVAEGGAARIIGSAVSSQSISGVLAADSAELIVIDSEITARPRGGDVVGIDAVDSIVEIHESSVRVEFGSAVFLAIVNGGSLLVADSTLELAGGTLVSAVRSTNAVVSVQRSSIWADESDVVVLLSMEGGESRLENSVLDSGETTDRAIGVFAAGSPLTIRNSTLGTPTGASNTPISVRSLTNDPVPTLIENTLLHLSGGTGGYFIGTDSPDSTTIANSNLYGPGRDVDIATFARGDAITPLDSALVSGADLSFDDPVFTDSSRLAGGGDWSLTASSPASVTSGGLDGASGGWGFATDISGTTRTPPWSIGAYEYD